MSESKGSLNNNRQLIILIAVVAAIAYFAISDLQVFWNILLAVMGFSAVVFIHELGHFIFAKLFDIKVETFSIFLPPVLLGVRRTENGLRFRILPKFFPKENDPDGDGLLSFTVGKKTKASDTEYRIGLIPVAGYVKMLGQEDTGADKQSDDPRSYSNKPIAVKMAVIAAGVTFNVIAAVAILMVVYLVGINRMPSVVGAARPDSPAARAGLRGGDEIIEIAGKSDNLDFGNILMAAALSKKDEKVSLKIKHPDGSIEDFAIAAELLPGMPVRAFGIEGPMSLKIAEISEADELHTKTALRPGDIVKTVNGRNVNSHWQLREIIEQSLTDSVTLHAQRSSETGEPELFETRIPLDLNFSNRDPNSESQLSHIYSIVPRLRIIRVPDKQNSSEAHLRNGDIILAVGDIENPTYKEMRDITNQYEAKDLSVKVLRQDTDGVEKPVTVTVVPKKRPQSDWVQIGIAVVFDAEHPVVAKTIAAENGSPALDIPRGAVITAVDGVAVAGFYDIIGQIRKKTGRTVMIKYDLDGQTGEANLDIIDNEKFITVQSTFAEFVPFASLQRLYKADNLAHAFVLGCKKSVWFIAKTYVTLKGLFAGNVSLKAMSGPVGIATITYKAVQYSFVSFLYLLAFISANLAVINFLPIPVVDGGVFVLLIVEKIKGSPISIRVQEVITYAGLVFLGAVFLYFTYNDIIRIMFG